MDFTSLELPIVRICSGEIAFADRPALVDTMLGSCVALAFTDPSTGTGAMCHAALPWAPVACAEPFRYVDEAIIYIVGRFERLGVPRRRLVVKLFGGADVLKSCGGVGPTVGRQNVAAAVSMLEHYDLRPCVRNVGGSQARRIGFVSNTGEVYVHRIDRKLIRQTEEMP